MFVCSAGGVKSNPCTYRIPSLDVWFLSVNEFKKPEVEKIGLYIHIPFCKRKCYYCHFVKKEYDPILVEDYIDALIKEIQLLSNPDYIINSIYIGGGSPSVLTESQVSNIMASVHKSWSIVPSVECTFEMNPEDVFHSKLSYLKALGVNRLSLGTQSFIDEDLSYLRRNHNVEHSRLAVEQALSIGFSNINIDFIIGLPTQNRERLEQNLSMLMNYDIPHVSAYLLEMEPSECTPEVSYDRHDDTSGSAINDTELNESRDHDLYYFTENFLTKLGYDHYEVSNYSKKDFNSKHNLKYWENLSYIGAGLSASGYEKGLDYKNCNDFTEYINSLSIGKLPRIETEQINPLLRRIIMGLRLRRGIHASHFNCFPKQVRMLLDGEFLIKKGLNIAVHPEKMLVLNEILTYFLETPV